MAQCSELCWQLRRMAGPRQVENVKYALQHNIGLGGAAVVTVYKLGFPELWKPFPGGRRNPAIELNPIEPTYQPLVTTSNISSTEGKDPKKFDSKL